MVYVDSSIKKFTSIHDRLSQQLNKCQQEVNTQVDDKRKNCPDPERPTKRNHPQ